MRRRIDILNPNQTLELRIFRQVSDRHTPPSFTSLSLVHGNIGRRDDLSNPMCLSAVLYTDKKKARPFLPRSNTTTDSQRKICGVGYLFVNPTKIQDLFYLPFFTIQWTRRIAVYSSFRVSQNFDRCFYLQCCKNMQNKIKSKNRSVQVPIITSKAALVEQQ